MSSLFEWFKSRNEENAINKTLVHMQKVLECVVEFDKGLTFLIEQKNVDLALKVFFRVTELEHQADGIRRNILNTLSKAELSPKIRENLTQLVKRIDDVANAANGSARILIYMNHNDFLNLSDEVHKKTMEMTKLSVDTVKKLSMMVKKLISSDEQGITNLGEEINTLEHSCDELHFAINRNLINSNNSNINPFSAIEIYNCILAIENITDNCEDVADYIIMLTISKKK
jgi:predicted phosphate transport protein (TIGR00153 family)